MIDSVRWKNSFADVLTSKHGLMVQQYLRDVVEPALRALDEQIRRWADCDEGGACFAQADAEDLLSATVEAFCLSIQSLWERQLREYLCGSARYLNSGSDQNKIQRANWSELNAIFLELRGVSLDEFDSYEVLDLLQVLGNACRHGDGKSSNDLFKRCPELWPDLSDMPLLRGGTESLEPISPPSFSSVIIPKEFLVRFITAIAWFWDDTEYIYLQSLERKHPSVDSRIIAMREEREKRKR